MSSLWDRRFEHAPNFTLGEFVTTTEGKSGVTPAQAAAMTERLRQEFMAHPERDAFMSRLSVLAAKLQVLRDFYGRPITITSGWRSERVNKLVGGAVSSYHLYAMAADIIVQGVPANQVQKDFAQWSGGLGLAAKKGFTHLDIGPKRPPFNY